MTGSQQFEQYVDDLLAADDRLARFRASKFGCHEGTFNDAAGSARNAIERQLKWNLRQAGLRAATALKT